MPTYEYACSACGHEWEQAQRIVDPPLDTCPKCSKSAAHRLISRGTNFILKGGGWYSDLYASPAAGGKKPETGDTASGASESKADSTTSGAEKSPGGKPGATEKAEKATAAETKSAAKTETSSSTPSST